MIETVVVLAIVSVAGAVVFRKFYGTLRRSGGSCGPATGCSTTGCAGCGESSSRPLAHPANGK